MENSSSRRVVITGLGVVCPLGNDPDRLVQALRDGESGIGPLTQVPQGVLSIDYGAEASDFTGDISDYGPMDKSLQRTIRKGSKVMCREIEMGVAVAQLALHNAGLDEGSRDRDRTGVIYGCDYIMSLPEEFATGIQKCLEDGEFKFEKWGQHGKPEINPLWLLKYLPNMPASHIAIYNDLRGPNNSITVREASAGAAIAEAYSTITRGHADVLVVGSTGSRIHPLRTLHASLQEQLATNQSDPSTMSRPFDESRNGSVVGEGAAAMIFETLEHAQARGATILGEVIGYGSSAVGPQTLLTQDADGEDTTHLRTAIANVLRAALGDRDPASVGHIHAHGLGTPSCDRQEAEAIEEVFGDVAKQPPVTTAKGHFGNLGAGGGMVEAIASLKSLGGSLFPIRNLANLASDCPIAACTSTSTSAGDSFISVNVTPQGQASAIMITSFQ
ncbi:beta-ketoacyl-[acyl-carrier-protein] synthase family protein [Rubripirellula amarantea]|uniref:3-oxoacyl-[acyl-carrier-protein] synthase 2 n=1 Tax=Rubripirellula amarantea TaxID=2527999 RepID=A0A5C5WNL1_9BACT|nr:beta-ketoacyl synthase N-terminal-like domain-containing protein [Rubripirellula amarantea]MDA8743637.1 beta-ketoacyl-[acyl-carrier-protein] synthase family protein [Rubripirellula amarantea]TWT52414.1 3-oxoacyl-[acyl-carrier-protein] synthase 2 [Rubripirellula amarantea]